MFSVLYSVVYDRLHLSLIAKRAMSALLICLGWLFWANPSQAYLDPEPPRIKANSVLLVDFHSGRVLMERNSLARVEAASLTKIMTSYVAFSALKREEVKLDDMVVISRNAYEQPGSRMFIEINSKVQFEDLLIGMIVQSGNDASVAIAEHVSGSEEDFVTLMNTYAQQLGMSDTIFTNPTGLSPNDGSSTITTAKDLTLLATRLIKDFPEYYHWYQQKEFEHNNIKQSNRNQLLWQDDSVDGIKTGYTDAAGYCLMASAEIDGMRLISVVMGTTSEKSRIVETQRMLNFGFRYFKTEQIFKPNEVIKSVRVWEGASETLQIGMLESHYLTLPRQIYKKLIPEINTSDELIAPIKKGSEFGNINLYSDDELIASYPLVALHDVEEASFFVKLWHQMYLTWRSLLRLIGLSE